MIGGDRILAVAAYDGAFYKYFGRFNERLGTPVRVNVLSGLVASIFMIVAVKFFDSGENSKFYIVLTIAISTTLMSVPLDLPRGPEAALQPRARRAPVPARRQGQRPDDHRCRPDDLLGGPRHLGRPVPGHPQSLFDVSYDFGDTWGTTG